jgi:CheY-like chemotaxis protein
MSNKVKKILIVEDEGYIVDLYRMALTDAGYEVLTATDGEEGLKIALEMPDLILLDVMMPKMHGVDVLKQLKASAQTKDIPVIMISNLSEDSVVNEAKENGALAFLIKSQIDPNNLARDIATYMQGHSSAL